ncbi:pectate lyase a [Colletotrichum truncatum]|uniref:Pectate lyase a n=1 Tax=Colletotrichum truncatum TaxID=5467 RepID=A0ACC3Z3A6_COLTU|nr:pectate lyase a [Colletotrichum truncatum]KAF6793131.1 pectate lyase a [Colletotrichum truncatum]
MKFTIVLATLFGGLAAASPTPAKQREGKASADKTASFNDKATLGYATLNGGTSGGAGGPVVRVSTLDDFAAAVSEKDNSPKIVVVEGLIKGSANVRIGSNKSIIGLPGAGFEGIGLYARRQHNIILRNIKSSKVPATNGDGFRIDETTNVWVDHCEFSSSLDQDKDFYDGLVDASHGSDYITVSYTHFHDHWKTSLIGHSDTNGAQDKDHLHITYANNYWADFGSRGPSVRFGTAHIYNSYYLNGHTSGINTREGAQVLVQSNAFKNVLLPITTQDSKIKGFANAIDNDLGGAENSAPVGSLDADSPPYPYTLLGSAKVESTVPGQAGQKLTF